MPAHLRRPRRLLFAGIPIALWLATIGATTANAATYSRDVYFSGAYEPQVDSRTCIAGSTTMMMNMLARRDLDMPQMSILRYAQKRDALNDRTQRGSDPLGWSRAATYYSKYTPRPTTYRWEAYSSESAALRRAARQIAATGKPVGLVVWHGRHAVVMTGFIASADPTEGAFTLQYVYISDPLGHTHYRYTAAGSPLNSYLETDATAAYDAAWYGKYVIVVPQG